ERQHYRDRARVQRTHHQHCGAPRRIGAGYPGGPSRVPLTGIHTSVKAARRSVYATTARVTTGVNGVCQTKIVPEFCTCGAQLPPDARFCHKCGKPQYDYPGLDEPEPATPPVEVASLPQASPLVQLSGEI